MVTSILHLLVQFSSVAQSCPTLCDPLNRSTPGLPVHHHLPECTQTHVHRVGDAIQASHPLSSLSPSAPKSLPASESFPMSQLFTWGGQSTGASFYSSFISSKPHIHGVLNYTLSNWIFFVIAIHLFNTYSLVFYCLTPSSRCWKHCNEQDEQVPYSDEVSILVSLKKWSEVKSLSRVRLCDPMGYSLPGSSVHGIFQAIVLEWIAVSFSRGSSQPGDRIWVSRIVDRRFTVCFPLESMKFSRAKTQFLLFK